MTSFTEREQIVEVVNRLFIYTDNQNWQGLKNEVFTEIVEINMVSMGAPGPERVRASEICHRWEESFRELDAVHHQAGNYLVDIQNDDAEVQAYSIASHYREAAKKGKTREFIGSYNLHLTKTTLGWRIDKFKYNLKYSTGNMPLH